MIKNGPLIGLGGILTEIGVLVDRPFLTPTAISPVPDAGKNPKSGFTDGPKCQMQLNGDRLIAGDTPKQSGPGPYPANKGWVTGDSDVQIGRRWLQTAVSVGF